MKKMIGLIVPVVRQEGDHSVKMPLSSFTLLLVEIQLNCEPQRIIYVLL